MQIHYFQRYHSKENVDTSNTMLMLSRLYNYNADKFFAMLNALILGQDETPEITFDLQVVGDESVPDAIISQKSFKIVVETKLHNQFQQNQLESNPESTVIQMDSVIGRVGGKCLLTIHFVETSLMLAFLRDSNTSASVIQIINLLDKVLGSKDFSRLFPVILTDNGSEFSNPKAIEKRDAIPCNRTNVFYCDPSAPYQKGACEVNHELIRRILPKGSSFDDLTQKDIFLMMDHINSYKRKKLNNRSPYETFSFYYGEDILKKLGCKPVAAENIILKPKLLKK